MRRIEQLNARYQRVAGQVANGVEVISVGDPVSTRVDTAVVQLLTLTRADESGLLEDLLGAAKALRWRLATNPQPLKYSLPLRQVANDVEGEADTIQAAVSPIVQRVLQELAASAREVVTNDPAIGGFLVESIQEVGPENCVVIAASGAAAAGLESWLGPLGVAVRVAGRLVHDQVFVDQGYAVGPPSFFPSSIVTAPTTEALSYFVPSWVRDRSIPRSELATYAECSVKVKARMFTVGDTSESSMIEMTSHVVTEADLVPQPVWAVPDAIGREPNSDEVIARRVLLSGGYAILLDDGERIRAVDPAQPGGERVAYVGVPEVSRGTYLLLRDGVTERRVLYDAALKVMGDRASVAVASQARWKGELQSRLNQHGQAVVASELAKRGLRTRDRVRAWIEPTLARPQSDRDFEILLEWLGLPTNPIWSLASELRRARARASANIANQLEQAVGAADMVVLERDGHLHLELEAGGFRGVVATRVLAISPHAEVVPRHDARVPFVDRGARWLE